MENCLVTKLKGTVNNDTLNKLGVLTLRKGRASDVFTSITLHVSSPVTYKLYDSSGTETYGETVNTEIGRNISSYAASRIEVDCKYDVTRIDLVPASGYIMPVCSTNDIAYITGLTRVRLPMYGNIKDLASLTSLTYIKADIAESDLKLVGEMRDFLNFPLLTVIAIKNCQISGKFEDICSLTSLTEINDASLISGSVEKFVAGQRKASAPRHSYENFEISRCTNITFNGTKLPNSTVLFSWAPNQTVNTNTDITSGDVTITIDSDGNKVS